MKDPVLLVLADECDSAAAAFVARHRGEGARLLAPVDLSSPGWSYRVGDAANSVAMVAGERIAAEQLGGVMTRLAGISPAHLPHVVEADREYVAAEMSAFLLAWLSALPCPVWNRPAAPSLSGPAWRWEQWRQLAMQAGLNVAPPTVTPVGWLTVQPIAELAGAQVGGRIGRWDFPAASRFGHRGSRTGRRWPRCSTRRRWR